MHRLLLNVFKNLEQSGIQYCLLRDFDQLDQFEQGGEVDLLIQGDQLPKVIKVLTRLGFANLPAPGHSPHTFFLAYDKDSDCWLKLDLVTELIYGSPIATLHTTLATSCLRHRQRCGPTFIPSPEDELITLLLHCVLDKGYFKPIRCERLRQLRQQITNEAYLSALLLSFWSPGVTWSHVSAMIDAGNWAGLLAQRETVSKHLTNRDRLGTFGRKARGRLLRKLNRWAGWLHPRACSVALLAPDGAGKSTLAAGIQNSFYLPVRLVYMGLYQRKAEVTRLRITGLSFLGRLITQWQRYLKARHQQAQGRLVIFDRYTYDALLPPYERLRGVKRWRRWLLAHTCPAPNLVLILDAPGEVLYTRKKEHSSTALEEQRQGYLQLRHYLPRVAIVDAARDCETVRREATALIWHSYIKNLAGVPQ